jgi:hypothetical protein
MISVLQICTSGQSDTLYGCGPRMINTASFFPAVKTHRHDAQIAYSFTAKPLDLTPPSPAL